LVWIRKEATIAWFQIGLLFRNLFRGYKENHESFSRDSWLWGRDLNTRPPEYDVRMLPFDLIGDTEEVLSAIQAYVHLKRIRVRGRILPLN
jgi:hypothetical protein